jgi:hypothetical protein
MFIAGREVSLESRHTCEYEKWMKRRKHSGEQVASGFALT